MSKEAIETNIYQTLENLVLGKSKDSRNLQEVLTSDEIVFIVDTILKTIQATKKIY